MDIKYFEINKQLDDFFESANIGMISEAKYFTEWDSIKEKIIQKCFNDGELDTIVNENDIAVYIYDADDELKNKLYEIVGSMNINEMVSYIIYNYDEKIPYQIYYTILSEYYEIQKNEILREFTINNNIYRRISFNGDINNLLKTIEQNGTGNCWAKELGTTEAYYGDSSSKFDYIFKGEATLENVDWEKTIYLRMVADYENEVRLKPNAPIKVESIIIEEYDGSVYIDSTTYEYNKVLSVGSKYVY